MDPNVYTQNAKPNPTNNKPKINSDFSGITYCMVPFEGFVFVEKNSCPKLPISKINQIFMKSDIVLIYMKLI